MCRSSSHSKQHSRRHNASSQQALDFPSSIIKTQSSPTLSTKSSAVNKNLNNNNFKYNLTLHSSSSSSLSFCVCVCAVTKYIKYELTGVSLEPEGAVLERAFNKVNGSRAFQEQAIICLELLKAKALLGELRISKDLNAAYQASLTAVPAADLQAVLLASRVFSMVPQKAASDSQKQSAIDYDLIGFHALTETLWSDMRELYENMFLALAVAENLKLPAFEATKDFPFSKAIPSVALGSTAKEVLITGKLPSAEAKADLASGLSLWKTVLFIAQNFKGIADPSTLEVFKATDKLVSDKFHAAGII